MVYLQGPLGTKKWYPWEFPLHSPSLPASPFQEPEPSVLNETSRSSHPYVLPTPTRAWLTCQQRSTPLLVPDTSLKLLVWTVPHTLPLGTTPQLGEQGWDTLRFLSPCLSPAPRPREAGVGCTPSVLP